MLLISIISHPFVAGEGSVHADANVIQNNNNKITFSRYSSRLLIEQVRK